MRATNEDLRAWCENTWPTVYRHIYRLVQNKEEAEDLTQEAYLRVVRKGFPKGGPPHLGYMIAVAVNLVRDSWRRKAARGVLSPLEEAALEVAARTDEAYESSVQDALSRLPEEYREVIDLRIVQGYSRAETAEKLCKSEDAVRGLQYRALQALREVLNDHLEGVHGK